MSDAVSSYDVPLSQTVAVKRVVYGHAQQKLAPARGVMLGVLAGGAIWGIILFGVFLLR